MKDTTKEQLYRNLLDNDKFLQWLLYPTEELNDYWKHRMDKDETIHKALNDLKPILKGIKVVDEELSTEARATLWKQIEANIEATNRKKNRRLFFRYAAAIAVVIAAGVWGYFYSLNNPERIDFRTFISEKQVTENTSENVLIILDNNEEIEVKDKEVELVHDADGRMSVNAQIINKTIKEKSSTDKTNHSEPKINQLYVPYGKTSSIVMSDGTKIWVNSGSRVVYPVTFAENKREIYVEGEVYLEVTKNEKAPFFVKTDQLDISVLGTAFNVSAYKNDEVQAIVLTNGSVSVKDTKTKTKSKLNPNELYTFDKNSNNSYIEEVNVLDYVCWKYGFFVFKNKRLTDVLKKVERFYNVQIDYSQLKNDQTSLSGKLDLKESVEETFRTISITAPIHYKIDRDKIIISTNL